MKTTNIITLLALVGFLFIGTNTVSSQELKEGQETFKVQRYNHLVIPTKKHSETVKWCMDVLGFEKSQTSSKKMKNDIKVTMLQLGDFKLDVVSGKDLQSLYSQYDKNFESYRYQQNDLSIEVTDIKKLEKALNDQGIEIVMGPYANGMTNSTTMDILTNNGDKIRFVDYIGR